MAAKLVLAELTLGEIVDHPLIDPDDDEVSRLICESLDRDAFDPLRGLTVGEFRDWILDDATTGETLAEIRRRADSGVGGGGREADEQQGPGPRREQGPGGDPLP